MHIFFSTEISGDTCRLDPEESWHCAKVLRLQAGDLVGVTDGRGHRFAARLTRVHPSACEAATESMVAVPPKGWNNHIAIAPTKSADRFEWFLEKATEIGIGTITPLLCEHSERQTLKLPRLRKVLTSAMKQSMGAWLPELEAPVSFRTFLERGQPAARYIAHCETGSEDELALLYPAGQDCLVLIGPEGDFSPEEVKLALERGFKPVSLGPNRLRTETAGLVACHTVELVNRWKPVRP